MTLRKNGKRDLRRKTWENIGILSEFSELAELFFDSFSCHTICVLKAGEEAKNVK